MRGLTLLAAEGVNGTVTGTSEAIVAFKDCVRSFFGNVSFKDSPTNEQPFKHWHVKVREEIVALGNPSIVPLSEENNHLSPQEWHRMMEQEDIIVLDTRNAYETKIGKFMNAIDPQLKNFQCFTNYVDTADIPKDKKVLMYCTGGIRCEKALIAMQQRGYTHVYQLQGGILQYLKEYPEGFFEGECFVFDHRTSVNNHLKPSQVYSLCPHCGDPGKERITCVHCAEDGIVCTDCLRQIQRNTCSKNCAHLFLKKKSKEKKIA